MPDMTPEEALRRIAELEAEVREHKREAEAAKAKWLRVATDNERLARALKAQQKATAAAQEEGGVVMRLKELHLKDGRFTVSFDQATEVVKVLVASFRALLQDAPNFVRIDLNSDDGPYHVTIVRPGGKDPSCPPSK